jgi:hypothetical protein
MAEHDDVLGHALLWSDDDRQLTGGRLTAGAV